MTWVENASSNYLVVLAIAVGLVLLAVRRVERRLSRSDGIWWREPGR